jgi:Tol biopolymer transport system component
MKTSSVRETGRLRKPALCNWHRAAAFPLLACLLGLAAAAPIQPVSTPDPSQAPPAGGGGNSFAPVISADGRYVLFSSAANNLVLATNGNPIPLVFPPKLNVFRRDRTNGTTSLVSVNLSGTAGGNGDSYPSAVSTNGRYALFESSASDLVPGDTNSATDVFMRDLLNGTTLLVSASTNGGIANGLSRSSVMTPDGRYVAFVSAASNLVPGDTNNIPDVFVRDLQAGTTVLASVGATSTNSLSPTGSSESPDLTPDGRYVAFSSTATNLVPGVTAVGDIYVRDLTGGTTTWASTSARAALQSVGRSASAVCYNLALSADGQFVAYEASPVLSQNAWTAGVILRYSLASGFTDLVHTNAAVPLAPYEEIRSLDMTPDGRFIAFVANTNGTSGATTCVYVWDAVAGTAALASGNLSGSVPAGSSCDWPTLDAAGRFVAFTSSATNMVTNTLAGSCHLYVRDTQTASNLLADVDTNSIGVGTSLTSAPRLSADGRFVAFESLDAGLVPNDSNHAYDVFVRDALAGATELISARDVSLPSLSPNGGSFLSTLSVSTNARYIAFASDADNLVPNDTNGCRDVFVRDLLLGTNFLVSVSTNGAQSGDAPSMDSAISGDGRYVAFTSRADNLVAGDNNSAQDVFVRDLQSGTTTLISVKSTGGGPGNADSYSPIISQDGRYVLFRSKASNLASGSFSGADNLFLRDRQAGTTRALTTTGGGTAAITPSSRYIAFSGASASVYLWDVQAAATVYTATTAGAASGVAVSPDGNRLVYALSGQLYAADRGVIGPVASGRLAGLRFSGDGRFLTYAAPLNSINHIYRFDFHQGTNLTVSRDYNTGGAANGACDSPDLSSDGRFVAYRSAATNLVPGDTNGVPDLFLYDCQAGTTSVLSASRYGGATADNRSLIPVFSADGQALIFQSWASDLAAQDFNQSSDIWAYSLYYSGQIPLFSASIVSGSGTPPSPWITWPLVPTRSYRVQFKNRLSDAAWQDMGGGITIQGNQARFNDLSAGSGPRFYRVVAY